MRASHRWRALLAAAFAAILTLAVVACGDDDEDGGDSGEDGSGAAIEANPDNEGVALTVGSKNFTEQFVLGEIYAQALEAAGYEVKRDLNLGSEQIALRALRGGDVDGYPEYTSTALTSFFDVPADQVPGDGQEARAQVEEDFAELGLVAFEPTPFESANAVGVLSDRAEELGVETISDLEGVSGDLTLFGSPECRQRIDCLVGLQENYGLEFAEFTPVDIGLRYEVLDKGQADLSIVFTTDGQLSASPDEYTLLEDDQELLPAGNVLFIASQETVEEAGPDFQETVELVQSELTEEIMQELNARVDIDKDTPEDAARAYLQDKKFIE